MSGKFPQTSRDLYSDPAHSHDDEYYRQNIGRITFRVGPGDKTDKAGTIE